MELKRVESSAILAAATDYSVQPESHAKALAGCDVFELQVDGKPVYALAGKVIGGEYVIVAAAGKWGADLTALSLSIAESEARRHGARSVAFQTVRPGLVKKSKRSGYAVAGWIVRKEL